ncbi:MAG: hypothetical protein AB4352_08840 [Hormoscilla sp.]
MRSPHKCILAIGSGGRGTAIDIFSFIPIIYGCRAPTLLVSFYHDDNAIGPENVFWRWRLDVGARHQQMFGKMKNICTAVPRPHAIAPYMSACDRLIPCRGTASTNEREIGKYLYRRARAPWEQQ